jgi:uncharacterized protein (TIGR03435 family)
MSFVRRAALVVFLAAGTGLIAFGQASGGGGAAAGAQAPDVGAKLPAFEVATIKPINPNAGGVVGFISSPGGRVNVGFATVKMLMDYAFDVQDFQVAGGPDWASAEKYDIVGVPPDASMSRTAKAPPIGATPSAEQRQMLLSLLLLRFGLKFHRENREGPVYFLIKGNGKLEMHDAKDKDADSRGNVMNKGSGVYDGETFGTNVTMAFWARQLGNKLRRPVVDQTGLTGSYDFHLAPFDPENTDYQLSVFESTKRLGLDLKAGKGPIETIVIDSVSKPTEN